MHLRSWVSSQHVSKPMSPRVIVLPCLHSWVHLGVAEWGGGQRLCSPHVPARALPGAPVPGRGTATNVRACAELLKAEAGGGAWDPTFKPTERRGRLRLGQV